MSEKLEIELSCIIDEDFKIELRELIREVVKEVISEPAIDLQKILSKGITVKTEPERVLSPEDTKLFETLVNKMPELMKDIDISKINNPNITININKNVDAKQFIEALEKIIRYD